MTFSCNHETGDVYRFRISWKFFKCYYEIYSQMRPPCSFEMGLSAHLHEGDKICVLIGREPQTLERAKAIALVWMHGFSCYRRTGVFPNGSARVDVA